MNDKLKNFAKNSLREGLAKCTEAEVIMFKKMYAEGDLTLPIGEVVEKMDEKKLDWAMTQVQRTLDMKTL